MSMQVLVTLADGEQTYGAALVGADGERSVVRRAGPKSGQVERLGHLAGSQHRATRAERGPRRHDGGRRGGLLRHLPCG